MFNNTVINFVKLSRYWNRNQQWPLINLAFELDVSNNFENNPLYDCQLFTEVNVLRFNIILHHIVVILVGTYQ